MKGPTPGDSNRLSPSGLGSSPWLYIQSGALQGVTVHLGPAEFVHLKKIRGTAYLSAACTEAALECELG